MDGEDPTDIIADRTTPTDTVIQKLEAHPDYELVQDRETYLNQYDNTPAFMDETDSCWIYRNENADHIITYTPDAGEEGSFALHDNVEVQPVAETDALDPVAEADYLKFQYNIREPASAVRQRLRPVVYGDHTFCCRERTGDHTLWYDTAPMKTRAIRADRDGVTLAVKSDRRSLQDVEPLLGQIEQVTGTEPDAVRVNWRGD